MKYLTPAEYAKLRRCTRQAVADRIKRGTLHLVEIRIKAKRIAIDDAEYQKLQAENLDGSKVGE